MWKDSLYIPLYIKWTTPKYSKAEVDAAGATLVDPMAELFDRVGAAIIAGIWCSSHYFPLFTLQIGLRQKATSANSHYLVARRTRRRIATEEKLRRFKWLSLSEMQDIRGCRAVVTSVARVRELVSVYKKSRHGQLDEDDYISMPKATGFRS